MLSANITAVGSNSLLKVQIVEEKRSPVMNKMEVAFFNAYKHGVETALGYMFSTFYFIY